MESSSPKTAVEDEAPYELVVRAAGAKALVDAAVAATTIKDNAAFVNCIMFYVETV